MKRIIGLSIAVLVILALVGGGTYALFGDNETSGATFTAAAGKLNLVVTTHGTKPHMVVTAGDDGLKGDVTFSKIKPGDSGTIVWTFTNDGDLPGTLTMPSTVAFAENDPSDSQETKAIADNSGVNLGLGDLMGIKLKYGATYVLGDASNYVPFSGLQAALRAQNQRIAAGGSLVYTLEWAVASKVKKAGKDAKFGTVDDVDVNDKIINGDTAQFNSIFTLTQ